MWLEVHILQSIATYTFVYHTFILHAILKPLIIPPVLNLLAAANAYTHLEQQCINKDCSATRITISNPPINLFDKNLISETHDFLNNLNNQTTNATKVVVFSSSTPNFWASHIDTNILTPGASTGPMWHGLKEMGTGVSFWIYKTARLDKLGVGMDKEAIEYDIMQESIPKI